MKDEEEEAIDDSNIVSNLSNNRRFEDKGSNKRFMHNQHKIDRYYLCGTKKKKKMWCSIENVVIMHNDFDEFS